MSLFDRIRAGGLGDAARNVLGPDFTERSRVVLDQARAEAVVLDHEYVGTEHLLLALLTHNAGVSGAVLANLGVRHAALHARTVALLQRGPAPVDAGRILPYTSRAKTALDLARAEARAFNHNYVGTEHLLLGLLREEGGIAAQLLVDTGVTLAAARAETLRLLGAPVPSARGDATEEPPGTPPAPAQ